MATHSSVLIWRIPETGEPGGPPSMASHRFGHDGSDLAAAAAALSVLSARKQALGNAKNPRDGGVWWAAVYGVAQSRTRLKQLSSSLHLKTFFGNFW